MKNFLNISLIIVILMLSACSQGDIVIDDFESGTYGKWVVEGDAFGDGPVLRSETDIKQQSEGGRYIADSFGGDDNLFGSLTSSEFTIERDYINFLIGGGTQEEMFIELLVEGVSMAKSHSIIASGELNRLAWDVREYKGKIAIIRIVDEAGGGWGHFMIDDIYQSNKNSSKIIFDYELSYVADSDYLLIPVDDYAPESKMQLVVNGSEVGEAMNIRVAQTNIGYWVPVDISAYKHSTVKLHFPFVDYESVGISQIKQSNSFDFDYNEKYRLDYHFTAKHGWMNDPNGMVYHDGEYHLFYQHNPYGSRWANMHWGHAVSKDLISWEHLPVGLAPDSLGAIFSGSAVIDKDNTAGFGKDALIAIYTSAGNIQTQSIAYSLDNGLTFTKYDGNPVLSDLNYPDFRDPKVFWHNRANQWVMSLATGQTITFYGSKNLKEWDRLSEFGKGIGSHAGVWECPDLFPLTYNGQTKWVLFVSINPGGPNGGSATQYFIGDFDGTTFTPDALPYPIWLDYGRDNYAGVTWSNIPDSDGRRLFIGWMNNWDYANDVPPVNFRGAMTMPRELKLAHNGSHFIIANPPADDVKNMRGDVKKVNPFKVASSYTVDNLTEGNKGMYEIEMTVETGSASAFSFVLCNPKDEKTVFSFDLEKGIFGVDRSHSGIIAFSDKFADKISEAPLTKKKSYHINLFLDKASTECFIDNGELVQTNTVFPSEAYNSLSFESNGEITISNLNIYPLQK